MIIYKMVTVFKTDVQSSETASFILNRLISEYPDFRINFDLEDCDNILRVEGQNIQINNIISSLQSLGHACEELPF